MNRPQEVDLRCSTPVTLQQDDIEPTDFGCFGFSHPYIQRLIFLAAESDESPDGLGDTIAGA